MFNRFHSLDKVLSCTFVNWNVDFKTVFKVQVMSFKLGIGDNTQFWFWIFTPRKNIELLTQHLNFKIIVFKKK